MSHEKKRPPSYSDSYYVLNGEPLEPFVFPARKEVEIEEPFFYTCVRFSFKGSLHLFFISVFETLFYFLFISVSENQGILNTINTYYSPLLIQCPSWSNLTKQILSDLFTYGVNKSTIDSEGNRAFQIRSASNYKLELTSLSYSLFFLFITFVSSGIIFWKQIPMQWSRVFSEHIAFVCLLAFYEYFFYITIIYKYTTLSTQELNKYMVDGIYSCILRV
jgi:hypothetical protein